MRELQALPGAAAVCKGMHCDFAHSSHAIISQRRWESKGQTEEKKWQKHMKKKKKKTM